MKLKGPYCDPNLKLFSFKQNKNYSLPTPSAHSSLTGMGGRRKVQPGENKISQKWNTLNKSNFSEFKQQNNIIYTSSRASTIVPEFIGSTFAVYNGKDYKTFGVVTPDHVGKKFGEFASTKKPAIYKKKK